MKDINATDASRGFSELLDAIEHRGESFRILRRGQPVALVMPPRAFGRDELERLLARHRPDAAWSEELAALRDLVREP
jgi:antitoxin (DNA-binding transcriptional repressor) of toxin-antitoxin stability system